MPREPMPDVIVVLPGIIGSVLQKHGKDVWGLSSGALMRGVVSAGASIKDLVLEVDPPGEDDLGDGIAATRLFPDTHLVPGLWKIDVYGRVTDAIQCLPSLARPTTTHCRSLYGD